MAWSVSLDRTWSRCQRQYYFQHKMASATALDEQRRRAQFLHDLMTPEIWQGKLVHKVIETMILPSAQARHWPKPDKVVAQAMTLAQKQFDFSRNKRYENITKKNAKDEYCVLASHYFGTSNDSGIFDQVITVIDYALRNLLNSERMKAFLIGRPRYRVEKTYYFEVGSSKVKAIPDLVMTNKLRGGIDIVDWKVARTSGRYDFQVGVYALAVKATDWLFQEAPGELHGYVINLLEPEPAVALADPYKVNDDVSSQIIDIVYEKIERIEALVKGRKWQELNIEDFMFARSIGTCALCNWKSMCVEMSNGSPAEFLPDNQSEPTQLTLPFD